MIKYNHDSKLLNKFLEEKLITLQQWALFKHIASDVKGANICGSALGYLIQVLTEDE